MTLLGSTKNRITKDKNGEDAPHLEITEAILVHCNIVNNNYQLDSNKPFGSSLKFSNSYIYKTIQLGI